MCSWNAGDCLIYEYFNKTFWKKVAFETKDFSGEVKHFHSVRNIVDDFCQTVFDNMISNHEPCNSSETKAKTFNEYTP